jgi:hypothetical protein
MPRSSDLFSAALMQSGGFAGWSAQHMKLKLEGTGRRQFFYGFPMFSMFSMFLHVFMDTHQCHQTWKIP